MYQHLRGVRVVKGSVMVVKGPVKAVAAEVVKIVVLALPLALPIVTEMAAHINARISVLAHVAIIVLCHVKEDVIGNHFIDIYGKQK